MPYNEANPVRAAHLQQYAIVGEQVTYLHPLGKVSGTITRKTASSVWVDLELPTGNTVNVRFSQRQNGEFKMHGKGLYSPALFFPRALADREAKIKAEYMATVTPTATTTTKGSTMNKIAAATIVLAAAVSLTACSSAPVAPVPTHTATVETPASVGTSVRINGTTYTPCVTEDYDGPEACFWDAGARSNGKGHSFIWTGSKLVYTN